MKGESHSTATRVADRQEKLFHGKADSPVQPSKKAKTASVAKARQSAFEVSEKSGANARAKAKQLAKAKAEAKELQKQLAEGNYGEALMLSSELKDTTYSLLLHTLFIYEECVERVKPKTPIPNVPLPPPPSPQLGLPHHWPTCFGPSDSCLTLDVNE